LMSCVGIERGMQFWSSWCTICRLQVEMVVGQLSRLTEEGESLSLSPPLNSWCIIVLEKLARITLLYVSLPSPRTSFPAYLLSLQQKCYWSLRPPSIPWERVPTLHAKEMPLLPKISLCTWGRTSLRRDIIVPCDTHISTEGLFQLALFSMKKFPSKSASAADAQKAN
jgi:hypothetical protein